jgi:DNA polymerase III alpha subunit
MAALLTIESENTDKIRAVPGRVPRTGVPVSAADINRSELPFTVQPDGVRFGWAP